jgi:hypothetical protein
LGQLILLRLKVFEVVFTMMADRASVVQQDLPAELVDQETSTLPEPVSHLC